MTSLSLLFHCKWNWQQRTKTNSSRCPTEGTWKLHRKTYPTNRNLFWSRSEFINESFTRTWQYFGLVAFKIQRFRVVDFNISEDDKSEEHLRKHFTLKLKNQPTEKIAPSGNYIDSTFSRNKTCIQCVPYLSNH